MTAATRRGRLTLLAMLALAVAATLALASCAKRPEAVAEAGEPPLALSLMTALYAAEPPVADSPVMRALEQATNTRLSIKWVPFTAYNDKFHAMLASGDMPKAILALDDRTSLRGIIANSAESGMFWEIGPYLARFPNLSRLDPQVLANGAIHGKIYGLYRERELARQGIMLRKDWLARLGLKPPRTLEELRGTLRAFTRDDPDGDRLDDTFGLALSHDFSALQPAVTWFGGFNGWGAEQGRLVPSFMTPPYMEALTFFRELYAEGLVNADFPIAKDGRQVMKKGNAGMWIGPLADANGIEEALQQVSPSASLDIVPAVQGPRGLRSVAGPGYYGMYLFPKSSVPTEAELLRVLAFFDKLCEEPLQNLLRWGVEGRQYTIADGGVQITADERLRLEAVDLNGLMIRQDRMLANLSKPIYRKVNEALKANEAIAVPDLSAAYYSRTQAEKGEQLRSIIDEARVRYVTGELDAQGFSQAVAAWRTQGGDRIIEEYNQAYRP